MLTLTENTQKAVSRLCPDHGKLLPVCALVPCLRGVLDNLLRKTMFELPPHEHVARCLVDEGAVNGITGISVICAEADASDQTVAQSGSG